MYSIVVADPNPASRQKLRAALEPHEFRVLKASDGLTCLQLAQELQPDLILANADLQSMDGLKLLRRLRQNPATSYIPFIFLADDAQLDRVQTAREFDAVEILSLPVSIADLLLAMHRQLDAAFHWDVEIALRSAT